MPRPVAGGPAGARMLSAAMVLCVGRSSPSWCGSRAAHMSWSRRSAPLFVGLAVAEVAYGQDPGGIVGTSTALVLCTVVAPLVRAFSEPRPQPRPPTTERTIGSLSQGPARRTRPGGRAHRVADHPGPRRRQRRRRAARGSRGARPDARRSRSASRRLCHAAVEEARHLDHLLHRSPDEPVRPFDVASVAAQHRRVRALAGCRRAIRAPSRLLPSAAGRPRRRPQEPSRQCRPTRPRRRRRPRGRARPRRRTDHLPGRRARPRRAHRSARVRARLPGPDQRRLSGSASTRPARLMLAQGGDLVLDPDVPGACFVATLPAAVSAPAAGPRPTDRIGTVLADARSVLGGRTMTLEEHPPRGRPTLTVALVDDHRLLVDALALALDAHGVRGLRPRAAIGRAAWSTTWSPVESGPRAARPRPRRRRRRLPVGATPRRGRAAGPPRDGRPRPRTDRPGRSSWARVGVVPKSGPFGDLVQAVVAAARRAEVMAPLDRLRLVDEARRRRERHVAALAPFGHLTPRECEVLRELTDGHAVTEIARSVGRVRGDRAQPGPVDPDQARRPLAARSGRCRPAQRLGVTVRCAGSVPGRRGCR